MGNISDIVQVAISASSPGPTRASFGTPLILSMSAAWAERTRVYATLAAVAADFATTTYEYLTAAKLFSQKPSPNRIIIGRCANKPTQAWKIAIVAVKDSTVYQVKIGGTLFSITSGGSATNDAIADALAAAITGVSDYTAASTGSGGSKYVTVTASTAGDWTSIALTSGMRSLLSVQSTEGDAGSGVTADLTAIAAENNTWYAVLTAYKGAAIIEAIAAYVEAAKKLFVCDTQDTACASSAFGTSATDVGYVIEGHGYARTALFYHADSSEFEDAAVLGKCLPYPPGSETWKFKSLAGVTPDDDLTDTERANLEARHMDYYYTVAGVPITTQGTVADGEFIDVVRFLDALGSDIGTSVFGILANQANPKIPLDDFGIALVQAQVLAALKRGVAVGGLAATPAPSCTVPAAADISDADRAARRLSGVGFTGTLAGAVHSTSISGTVTT